MKKLFIPFVALFLVVSLGSCEKITDLADIDIPLEVQSDNINLDVPSGKTLSGYNFGKMSGSIDLFQGELKDYKSLTDKIRKFKADKVYIKVISVNPTDGVNFNSNTKATITSESGKSATIDLSGKQVKSGTEIIIDSKVMSVVNDILNERKEFKYEVSGGFDRYASAVVVIYFKGKVTVNPLK